MDLMVIQKKSPWQPKRNNKTNYDILCSFVQKIVDYLCTVTSVVLLQGY